MRGRLAVTVLAVTTMVVVAFLLPLAVLVRTVVADRAVAGAEQEARSLAGILAAVRNPASTPAIVDQLNADRARQAVVVLADGRRIGASVPMPDDRLAEARDGRAFTFATHGDRVVVVPVRTSDADLLVAAVAVPAAELHRGVTTAWAVLGGLAVALVALGVALADRLARSTTRSLAALGDVTSRLRQGELDARAKPDGPAEVADLAAAVNGLANQIEVLLAAEREEAADLSHRLRTPLTALRLQVEQLPDGDDRARLANSVERLTAEVTSLIRTARAPRAAASEAVADLADVVDRRVAFWSVLARQQQRTVVWERPVAAVIVPVAADRLTAAVDALFANVFQHAPDASRIIVTVDGATLVVEDDGAGFAELDPAGRGRSAAGSTGLGLDIARQCAVASGGELALGRSSLGGARVEVRLGGREPAT